MDETDFLDRVRLVAEAFRPAAPIDRRELFAGRSEQIAELFSIVSQPGQHAIVYGERGVGKTSLGLVAAELLGAADVLCAWATCDASDDFASVWRKALGEIGLTTTRQSLGFGEQVGGAWTEPADRLAPEEHVVLLTVLVLEDVAQVHGGLATLVLPLRPACRDPALPVPPARDLSRVLERVELAIV